jgi:Spy/CpxP family protein refolding chaperone
MWRHVRTGPQMVVMLSIALLTTAFILPSEARANPRQHWEGKSDFASRILHSLLREQKELNLSEEQVGKIRAIAVDYARTRIRGEAEAKLAEVDVRSLVFDQKAELPALESAMKKSESAKTALRLERVKALRAAAAVLTPEQLDKWRASMRDRHRDGKHVGVYGDRLDNQDLSKREG